MKNQGRLIAGLVLTLIVAIFAVLNVNTVAINFGFAKVHWPLILILIVVLLLGALIAVLVSAGNRVSDQRDTKQAVEQQKSLTTQVATLKNQNEQLQTLLNERDATIEKLSQQVPEKATSDTEHPQV
ncbi:LapA family protein [Furfurilactobacillus siliginis]|uniref:Membrane protein n=1 Tax=Furfurilactobacillus siliginis TaxID=348151 RepID=A0A0R2L0T2_9LACO|nr:lipopolysaccharide assembly protein LapA domain-containing protein [Furfurilactobacillus siliginis]KRN95401.1 hypothetical protein IV55_GL002045 [Furfurilactobacillus siliginis]GEK28181.1 membrane protein [Furfurilactobacillus siliginis]